jgi:hypothetical protein
MKEINRREFLKSAGISLAGSLMFPSYSLGAFVKSKRERLYNDSENVLLARMLFGEGRELFDDKIDPDHRELIMIGWTAINRAEKKFKGDNLKEVLLAKKQYSCFNDNPKDKRGYENFLRTLNPWIHEKENWIKSLKLSENILEGKLSHLNYRQDHYHTKNEKPYWAKSKRMRSIWVQPSFKHNFYEDIKA